MKKLFLFPVVALFLASCSSDDNNNDPVITDPVNNELITFGGQTNPLEVGGATEPNQVYVDLSGTSASPVIRDSWDLGFYSGSEFRVIINGAVRMAAKQLETTDITETVEEDNSVAVGTFDSANMAYVDDPQGETFGTAFGELATSEAEAKVFLVNRGSEVPTTEPAAGSSNVAGDSRGWKKVKIWVDGSDYKIQFADLASVNFEEVTISKNSLFNHVYFNLGNGEVVQIQPQKDSWDMNFTTFTNEVFQGEVSAGAYFYSDFIVINTLAGVAAYKVEGGQDTFDAFTALDVVPSEFSNDQRAIGAEWRNVTPVQLYDDVFFVLKDSEGNLFKIKFISMLNTEGHRGFPLFQYQLL